MKTQVDKRKPPVIYDWDDHRGFLKAYYDFNKKEKPHFSFTQFARALGLKSRSYLQLVISKERNIGLQNLERFSSLFPDQPKQFEFFRKLVLFEQSKSSAEKSRLAHELSQLKPNSTSKNLKFEWYALYSDWYYFPILLMPKHTNFKRDSKWIQERLLFPVSLREINSAKKKFLSLGLWKEDDQGKIVLQEENLQSYQELDKEQLRKYHKKMLELSAKATDLPQHKRYVSGSTLLLSAEQFKNLSNEIHETKSHLFKKYSSDEEVAENFQLSIALIPLTNQEIKQ